jgi:hypothetical protein
MGLRNDLAADRADAHSVIRVGVLDADTGAIIVGKWFVRHCGRGPVAEKLSRWRREEKHDRTDDRRMIEAHPVAELVREKRFQIVRALCQRGWRGKGVLAVVAEKRVGVQNLPAKAAGPDEATDVPGCKT